MAYVREWRLRKPHRDPHATRKRQTAERIARDTPIVEANLEEILTRRLMGEKLADVAAAFGVAQSAIKNATHAIEPRLSNLSYRSRIAGDALPHHSLYRKEFAA